MERIEEGYVRRDGTEKGYCGERQVLLKSNPE
jgi:hypothetical protein